MCPLSFRRSSRRMHIAEAQRCWRALPLPAPRGIRGKAWSHRLWAYRISCNRRLREARTQNQGNVRGLGYAQASGYTRGPEYAQASGHTRSPGCTQTSGHMQIQRYMQSPRYTQASGRRYQSAALRRILDRTRSFWNLCFRRSRSSQACPPP